MLLRGCVGCIGGGVFSCVCGVAYLLRVACCVLCGVCCCVLGVACCVVCVLFRGLGFDVFMCVSLCL